MKNKIRELIDKLNHYTTEYDKGAPQISDKEWDALYYELISLERESGIVFPDSPTQSIQQVQSLLPKVQHTHWMSSLDKTKDINTLENFIGDKACICMGKMDGLTCALRYEDGVLVRAETRGDGHFGENILNNIIHVKNVPLTIPNKKVVEIDGEIICKYDDFEKFSKDFKNPRNFAAGSIRLLDPVESSKRNLTFIAWDWINNPFDRLGTALVALGQMGFTTVPFWDGTEKKYDSLEEVIEFVKKSCKDEKLPIDGLVFKYDFVNEYQAAGATSHHPNGGLAFKFYDEVETSTVTNIDWTMGRIGSLTPVIEFDPVEIDGTEVSRASAHNYSILKELWGETTGQIGDTVTIFKANAIIPQISNWEHNGTGDTLSIPLCCPICGGPVSVHTEDSGVEEVWCDNDDCEGKLGNRIVHYCDMKKGMAIKGLSKATIEKLMDKGWLNSIVDLYSLKEHRDEWVKLPGFGQRSVDNLLAAIEASKKCSLWQFISAIGIPQIGVSSSHDLANEFGTWANFFNSVQEKYKFYTIPNFGFVTHFAILKFDYSEANIIATLYLDFQEEKKIEITNSLKGTTVVITGKLHNFKNRDEFTAKIVAAGGKVASSVTGSTNYLITNDTSTGTAKNKKAQELGVSIISEDDFIHKFLG